MCETTIKKVDEILKNEQEENNFVTILSSKNCLKCEFLRYGIEIKISVILLYKLATHSEQMSAMFLPNIIWIGLQLGMLSQK